jgi:hypothetical protein
MNPFDINFAGGRLRSLRPRRDQHCALTKAIVFIGLACLLWLCGNLIGTLYEGQRLSETTRQFEHAWRSTQTATIAAVPPSLTDNQTKSLNDAISSLNLPWRDLFNALENSNSPDIALISLHADSATSQLSLIAESNAPSSLLEYVANLKEQSIFSAVLPVSHEENTRDKNAPLRMQLNVRWVK